MTWAGSLEDMDPAASPETYAPGKEVVHRCLQELDRVVSLSCLCKSITTSRW